MSGVPRPMREQVIDFDFTADDGTPMQLRVTRWSAFPKQPAVHLLY